MQFFVWDKDQGIEAEARQIEADDGDEAAKKFAELQDHSDGEFSHSREVCVRYQGGRLEVFTVKVELEPSYYVCKVESGDEHRSA